MSVHPNPDLEESLSADKSWMTPEQARKVEIIYLETALIELEAQRRLAENAPFDEEIRYIIRTLQEKKNQIAENQS